MIPKVKIDQRGTFKYIVALQSESFEDFDALRGTLFIRGSANKMSHDRIVTDLCKEAKEAGEKLPCPLGGGRVRIDFERKQITLYDESVDFGKEPNREDVARLIKETGFQDFTVEVKD